MNKGNPLYYKIKDLGRDSLIGTFYVKESQKIYKDDHVFCIESIIKNVGARKVLCIWSSGLVTPFLQLVG